MKFNHKSAAALVRGERISDEAGREFVHRVKLTHDECERMKADMADLRAELVKRDAEIAMLKSMLMELEDDNAKG